MNTLTEAIHDYLSMRQGLGFKLVQVEGLLKNFAVFMDTHGGSWVTVELALQWAGQPVGTQLATWAKRLNAVRGFARFEVRRMLGPRFLNGGFFRIGQGEPNRTSILKMRSRNCWRLLAR